VLHARLTAAPRGATGEHAATHAGTTAALVAALATSIGTQLDAHPDAEIFQSLPRSGSVRAARLSALT